MPEASGLVDWAAHESFILGRDETATPPGAQRAPKAQGRTAGLAANGMNWNASRSMSNRPICPLQVASDLHCTRSPPRQSSASLAFLCVLGGKTFLQVAQKVCKN